MKASSCFGGQMKHNPVSLDALCEVAAGQLPEEWMIEVMVGSGYANLYLTNPQGDRSDLYQGWNPHKLTISQVEDGYRLLTAKEVQGPQRNDVEYWWKDERRQNKTAVGCTCWFERSLK